MTDHIDHEVRHSAQCRGAVADHIDHTAIFPHELIDDILIDNNDIYLFS